MHFACFERPRAMFVDLHLHLLPGVDDGCQTVDDAVAMARTLVAVGVSVAAPSPHNREEYASLARPLCEARLGELKARLAELAVPLALHPNAENYFLHPGMVAEATGAEGRKIGGAAGKYLLVEAPYAAPVPSLMDTIFRLKLKGVTPLVAHPERCFEFERKGRAAEVVGAGALLQLDVGALIGRYGKPAQRLARQFLDEGLYAVVASDAHSPVGLDKWLPESLKALEKAAGRSALGLLFQENPADILAGKPVYV